MKRAFQICITLAALIPIAGFSCGLDAVAQYVNGQGEADLSENTQSRDQFIVACPGAHKVSGAVSKTLVLRMTDGSELDVSGMKRSEVLAALRNAAVMMNTPNGVNIVPKRGR